MNAADTKLRIAKLDANQVRDCLNGVVKGWSLRDAKHEDLFAHEGLMADLIRAAGDDPALDVTPVLQLDGQREIQALREILEAAADHDELRAAINARLDSDARTLFDPIVTPLVLAGITLILSTHVTLDYESSNGKRTLKVHIEKKPTDAGLIKKILGIAGHH